MRRLELTPLAQLACCVWLACAPALAASCPPTHAQYPSARWVGGHALPRLDTADKRMFRTMIRLGARSGDPFADRYRLATWGCGTSCQQAALVDTRTGEVLPAPDASLGYAAQPGSRLLIVSPLEKGESMKDRSRMAVNAPPRYYVLQGRTLVQVCGP